MATQPKAEVMAAIPPNVLKIKQVIDASAAKIAEVCAKHVSSERLLRVAMATIYQTPALQKCDPWSIANALVDAASCGLEAGGPAQEGFLIPYWNSKSNSYHAQFQPSWRGLLKNAREATGALIDAHVVYQGDEFDYSYGIVPNLHHRPALQGRGEPVAVYAFARFPDGGVLLEVMPWCKDCLKPCPACKGKGKNWSGGNPKECAACHGSCASTQPQCDVEKARAASQSPFDGPWVDWPAEQARKTPIKRLCKRIKGSPALAKAVELDNQEYRTVELPRELETSRPMPRRLGEVPRSAAPEPENESQEPPESNPLFDSDAWRDAVIEFQDLAREMKWSDSHIEKGIADAKAKVDPVAYLQQGIQQLKAFKAEKAGAAQGDK